MASPFDSRVMFGVAFGSSTITSVLWAQYVNHDNFVTPFNDRRVTPITYMVSYGRCAIEYAIRPSVELVTAITVGELFNTRALLLNQRDTARRVFITGIRGFIRYYTDSPVYDLGDAEVVYPEANVTVADALKGITANTIDGKAYPTSFEGAYAYAQAHHHLLHAICPTIITVVTSALLAICKTGTVSDGVIDKVSLALENECSDRPNLMTGVMTKYYNWYARSNISPAVMRVKVPEWLRRLPDHALRVRLVIEQSSNHGITGFTLVSEAMTAHPTFHWGMADSG